VIKAFGGVSILGRVDAKNNATTVIIIVNKSAPLRDAARERPGAN